MDEFEQYYTEDLPPELDWISSLNTVRTDKNVMVKNVFSIGDTETVIKQGQRVKVTQGNASYAILLSDFIVAIPNVGVAPSLTLPKASNAGLGKIYIIKDVSGSALTTTITVTPNGTETINGDTTTLINTNFGSVRLYCDGANWFII